MNKLAYLRTIALFLTALIISLPFALAEEYSIRYDQNGNIIYDQESNVYREYNELNQLSRTRINNISGTILQEYTYDPIKERIFIKDEFYSNGTLKSSTYYFDDDYVVIQNSSGTYNRTNVYQDGVLVGYEDFDGKKRYILPDHEGSAHLILNESGDVIEENLFSPFAEPLEGIIENKFSYEAKEYDSLTQDYDFHFRKYNPNLRIFMQPDTLIQNVYDPQSLNRYAFERSNPQKNVDPTGHQWQAWGTTLGIWVIPVIILTLILTVVYIKEGIGHDPEQSLREQKALQEAAKNAQQEANNQKDVSQGNTMTPDYEKIIEKNPPKIDVDLDQIPKELVLEDKDKKEQSPLCEKCYKKLQVDQRGQAVIVTFNERGQEVSREVTGRGGGGGSTVIPDPSGRKDRFGNPIYVPKPPEPKPPKPTKKTSKN